MDHVDTGLHIDALRLMADWKVAELREDEFGAIQASLVPSSLHFRDGWRTEDAPLALGALPLDSNVLKHHKLELVMGLCIDGWEPQLAPLSHNSDNETKEFSLPMVMRSKLYFPVLCDLGSVWSGGLSQVYTNLPEQYYQAVLTLPDLSSLDAMTEAELRAFGNHRFAALVDGNAPAAAGVRAMVPIADADDDHAPIPLADMPDVIPHDIDLDIDDIVVAHEGVAIREVDMRERQIEGYSIKYDSGSHSSGIVRAYIKCASHARCFKYRQTNRDPTSRERHAYILAWARCGPNVSRAEHVDRNFNPTAAQVEAAMLVAPC